MEMLLLAYVLGAVLAPPLRVGGGAGTEVSEGGRSPENFCQSYVGPTNVLFLTLNQHIITKFSSQRLNYIHQKFDLGKGQWGSDL